MQSKINRPVIAWALYDWASSAFSTTVMAVFFPIFFRKYWSLGSDTVDTTARLGFANSIAGLAVALMAPVIGAIADRGSTKKRFLFLFAYMGTVMTAALFLVDQGDWQLAIFCYVMAVIGFNGSIVFYDSLLSVVSPKDGLDFISCLGFSLGYLGGGLLLAVNVWMTLQPETFGLADAAEAVRVSFLLVGIWWGLFSIPLFLFVKEPGQASGESYLSIIVGGLGQLRDTFREIKRLKPILLFLIAYWLYIDGVDTIVVMAVNYGMSIGFTSNNLIAAILLVQFVGFPAAIGFGYLGGRIGCKNAIYIAIFVYLCMSVWGAFLNNLYEFYILAVCIGLVQGGIQALSRSYYAKLIPQDKTAEYFGFYNMIGKFAAIIGPVLIGGCAVLAKNLGFNDDIASRISLSSISLLFLLGGTFLIFSKGEVKK